jgi:hypothetical protein
MTSAQTSPCSPESNVTVNPNRFAVISFGHDSPSLTGYRFEVKDGKNFGTVQEFVFQKSELTSQGSNCYLTPIVIFNDSLVKDGVASYISRFRAESSDPNLTSTWSETSVPFVLASKLRVGAIYLR